MSQIIFAGHRGYKALYPENTIESFEAAVRAGCNVVELDLHTSSDGFVVITHDVNTGRVFGENYNISKTKYRGVLDQLLTIAKPRAHMPLLDDVFAWCIKINNDEEIKKNGREIKLMLDIKADNDPVSVMEKLWTECQKEREGITSINPVKYWEDKLILGLWNANYYHVDISKHFPIVNITFDVNIAKKFYNQIREKDSNAKLHAVSIINLILYRESDRNELLKWAKEEDVKLWFWTVNENVELETIIKLCSLSNDESLLEGVVTDDAVKLLEKPVEGTSGGWKYTFKVWFKARIYALFLFLFRRGYNLRPLFIGLKSIGFI